MSNWMHWLSKRISHNPWIFVWLMACAGVLWFAYGCESTTLFGGKKVTRQELQVVSLQADADYKSARANLLSKIDALDLQQQAKGETLDLSIEELDRKDEQKVKLLEGGVSLIRQFAPAGVANITNVALGTLFPAGIGAFYLNGKRKDKVIKEKNGGSNPAPT